MSQSSHPHPRQARARPRRVLEVVVLAGLAAIAALSSTASAQQHQHAPAAKPDSSPQHGSHGMMIGPLGISHVRMGSGTSCMPDSSPMHANHKMWGDWTAMVHGVAFGQYDNQGSKRGDTQFGIVDWEMLMLMRQLGTGTLHLHGMASLEPVTIGAKGYPLLLQTSASAAALR